MENKYIKSETIERTTEDIIMTDEAEQIRRQTQVEKNPPSQCCNCNCNKKNNDNFWFWM